MFTFFIKFVCHLLLFNINLFFYLINIMAEGLPKLPGYSVKDVTQNQFQRSNQFEIRKGYALPTFKSTGIGRKELEINSVAYFKKEDVIRYDPSLTYGRTKSVALPQFIPKYCLNDGKCLTFRAFFKQGVYESPSEHYRVRYVNIIYFLENDTIQVMEPPIDNAGFPQGKYLKRCKIPKNNVGDYYHWKDLNVGIDIALFGTVFHTIDADVFTREYLRSQGIDVNPREDEPPDPYLQTRLMCNTTKVKTTPIVDDKMRRFLEFDGQVLRFSCVWDDRDSELGEMRLCALNYFLDDDTICVKEIRKRNDGRDPFPQLLRRIKLPKNWKDQPATYPACYLELSDAEVTEYYQPKDLLVGETIFVLGRRILLTDCDEFTRRYFLKMLNIEQKPKVIWEPEAPPPVQQHIPPHVSKLGSLEDSLLYCFKLMPKRTKRDVIKQLVNMGKKLQYTAKLVSAHPEDSIRNFIITYHLHDGEIRILEPPIRNSGIWGGKFLQKCLVPKPNNSDPDCPEYYTPVDFYIGAKIELFKHTFLITGADLFVYRYIQANEDTFPQHVRDNIRNYMFKQGYLKEDIATQMDENAEREKLEHICQIGKTAEKPADPLEVCREKLASKETEEIVSFKLNENEVPPIIRKDPINAPPKKLYGIQDPVKDCRYPVYIGKEPMSVSCGATREPPEIPCCLEPDCSQLRQVKDVEESKRAYYEELATRQKSICDNVDDYYCRPCPKDEESRDVCPRRECFDMHDQKNASDKLNQNKARKVVTFAENPYDPCAYNKDDQCHLKIKKDHCNCTNYNK